jgi:hypothetical protein
MPHTPAVPTKTNDVDVVNMHPYEQPRGQSDRWRIALDEATPSIMSGEMLERFRASITESHIPVTAMFGQ